jgi:hypothetical protein
MKERERKRLLYDDFIFEEKKRQEERKRFPKNCMNMSQSV